MRLAMLCGPAHGMKAMTPAKESVVDPAHPLTQQVSLKREECVRAIVAADAPVVLSIENQGQTVETSAPSRWSILPANRAFCAVEAMTIELVVKTNEPRANVALQPWLLP